MLEGGEEAAGGESGWMNEYRYHDGTRAAAASRRRIAPLSNGFLDGVVQVFVAGGLGKFEIHDTTRVVDFKSYAWVSL